MVSYKVEEYKNYGKVLSIENGRIELKVTIDVGPRIIYFANKNGENIMFNDDERVAFLADERFKQVFGSDKVFYNYGGHRIWVSPEDYPLSYYPDNDKVEYKVEGNTFTFIPPQQKVTDYQIILVVKVDETKPRAEVTNKIINNSGGIREIAAWGLTVLAPGGYEIIPQPNDYFKLLSNRSLVLWPYVDMTDNRVYWGKNYITIKSVTDPEIGPFKIGINNTCGWAVYIKGNTLFKKSHTHDRNATYPDRGCSFESYTDKNFIECETVGPIKPLMPGESCENSEVWEICEVDPASVPCRKDEKAIAEFLEKIEF